MRFEIDSNHAVLIFIGSDAAPALFQPYDPSGDGTPFGTKAQATKWAKSYIEAAQAEAAKAAELVEVAPEPIEG
jgi:hypothetical protein